MVVLAYPGCNPEYNSYDTDIEEYEYDDVEVLEGTVRIGDEAFNAITGIREIAFPESIKIIGDHAFFSTLKISSIILPDGLQKIDEYAFCGSGLRRITIPASVTEIGYDILYLCDDLESVSVEKGSYADTYCQENEYPINYLLSESSSDWLDQ